VEKDRARCVLSMFRFLMADLDTVHGLLVVLDNSIHNFLTQGSYPMWQHGHKILVESGLARFLEPDTVEIAEPLVFISIIHYFESAGKT
jgi:hypothetical protein